MYDVIQFLKKKYVQSYVSIYIKKPRKRERTQFGVQDSWMAGWLAGWMDEKEPIVPFGKIMSPKKQLYYFCAHCALL
jgi:hypothetical protein